MYVKLSLEPQGKMKHTIAIPTKEEIDRAIAMIHKGRLAN